MLDPKLIQLIDYYLSLAIRRRWFIIAPFCLAMVVGIYLSFTLPKVYQAETLILVEPQRVPTDFVRSLVSIDISARLSTISQQIMSRSNLEKIIKEFKLFEDERFKGRFLEEKVEILRQQIAVKITQAKGGADAFSISVKGEDPQKVQKVANALATYFIDENLKVREAQAIGTSSFLDDELNAMRRRLDESEEKMRVFRQENMGELPDQLQTNLSILTRLNDQLSTKEEGLRDAKTRLITIGRNKDDNLSAQNQLALARPDGGGSPKDETVSLEKLREQLEIVESRYTPRHPDVVRLKRLIAELEGKQGKNNDGTGLANKEKGARVAGARPAPPDPSEQTIMEIQSLEEDIAKIKQQILVYEKRVENTPKREQELLSLNRDYDNIQKAYNSLLNRKLESEIAVNMERKQKGEQFKILDFARLPEKPIQPNMQMIFAAAVVAGLGLGAGLVFVSDLANPSFRLLSEIEALGVPVLAAVPAIARSNEVSKWYQSWIITAVAMVMAALLLSGLAIVTTKGTDPVKAFVRKLR